MLFWAGIARHSLSANQIVRCFKLKKLEKDMRYQIEFLLPLKLEDICYFKLWPQNIHGQSVCRIFNFEFFDLLNLIPGVHYCLVLVDFEFVTYLGPHVQTLAPCNEVKEQWEIVDSDQSPERVSTDVKYYESSFIYLSCLLSTSYCWNFCIYLSPRGVAHNASFNSK